MYWPFVILIWSVCCYGIFCSKTFFNVTNNPNPVRNLTENSNDNQASAHHKQKRFIFQYGGVMKLVVGVTFPIDFGDKKPWRSLNCAYNFQAQYAVPTSPIYWWDRWDGRTLESARKKYDENGSYLPDESRRFLYAVIELYANKAGKNGRKCLLRAICDNASVDDVEGIWTEIIQAILTPGESDVDEDYKDAYKAGRYGAVCIDLYPECPMGKGILDDFAVDYTSKHYNLG